MIITNILSFCDLVGYEVICTLISVVWQSSILFLFAYLATWFLRHRSETIKHAIWVSVLVIMPFLPAVTWLINSAGSPVTEIKMLPNNQYFENITENNQYEIISKTNAINLNLEKSNQHVVSSDKTTSSIVSQVMATARKHFWAGIFITYLFVAGALILLTIGVGLRIHSWIRNAIPVIDSNVLQTLEQIKNHFGIARNVGIVESYSVTVPITFGTLHPVVLLPAGFTNNISNDDLTVVLVHELSHIKRHDPLILTLITIVRSLFFFNPLVWFASREASYYAESSCDNFAFRYTGTPHSYAEMLSRVATLIKHRSNITEYAVGIFATKKILLRRIYAILENSSKLQSLSKFAKAGIFLGLILTISIAASFPVIGKDEEISPLFHEFTIAAWKDDVAAIRNLLQNNPKLQELRGYNGNTLYHYAIDDDKLPALRILIEENIPLGIPDNDGNTPLLKAIDFNESESVRLFLENNADPESKDGEGLKPLEIASVKGFYDVADLLIDHGAEISIHSASLLGMTDQVNTILKNDPSLVNARNHEGKTPLHLICNRAKNTRIQLALDKNPENDRLNATENACFEIMEILLKNDADINKRDKNGWMPLHYAVKNGRYKEVELLLNRGAQVNALLDDGDTPLHVAAWDNHQNVAKILLENGADIDAVNSFGATPLDWAKVQGNSSVISYLENISAVDISEKLDSKKTWKRFLKSPYSEKALSAHMLALGSNEIAERHEYGRPEYETWFICKALRIKRIKDKDYRCIEICQGKPMARIAGKIIVFDSQGNIHKTLNDKYQYLDGDLLIPNFRRGIDHTKINELFGKEKWIDSPDINGDGFGEIPITIGGSKHKIYSSHLNDLPVILEAELRYNPNTKWPFEDIEDGTLLLQYCNEPTHGLRITVIPSTRIKKPDSHFSINVFDIRALPRELARYEWDTQKKTFEGPQNGFNNLWTINYPIMTE
ncbi:ankyrin repeat domain-containing protein [Candidatus Latescibacterota bacterium]